jgi:glycosyltransferase involved in cell wall biosynthesis
MSCTTVSAIVPTFNRASTIEACLNSILAQTWRPLEIIVVDDGSTDHTAHVLQRYGNDIRVYRQRNAGASAARNLGIRSANGQILSFLDSDDTWEPEKTERQVDLLRSTSGVGTTCCVSNARMLGCDGSVATSFEIAGLNPQTPEGVWLNPTEVLLTRFLFFNQVVAVWRHVLDRTGHFREDMPILEDYDLALRLSLSGPWAFTCEPLVNWRGGATNSLSGNVPKAEQYRLMQKVLSRVGTSSQWQGQFSQLQRSQLRSFARWSHAHRLATDARPLPAIFGHILLALLRLKKSFHEAMYGLPRMETRPC